MEQGNHSFVGGMNKDLSKSTIQNNSYLDANNVRITTQDGQTSTALINIKGNEFSFYLPQVGPVFEAYFVYQGMQTVSNLSTGAGGISINGIWISRTFDELGLLSWLQ